MGQYRRLLLALSLLIALCFIYLVNVHMKTWHDLQHLFQLIGLGEWTAAYVRHSEDRKTDGNNIPFSAANGFEAGTTKPVGSNYTKTVVMARMREDDVKWVDEELGAEIGKAIYVADDANAPLHPPRNKGHEAMVYLTYIIDHYHDLPDVAVFLHSHRFSWHNADLFDGDASRMVKHLSPERVTREGYMNMRCTWSPGCPDWMHPGETAKNSFKSEEVLIAKAWAELFPLDPIPEVLAQACCAQFALSRARMLAVTLDTYQFYRDWLLRTPLQDYVSGRIWEYFWQYVFTGQSTFCPVEHICYCDGFGACFGGEEEYRSWWNKRVERDNINSEWLDWEKRVRDVKKAKENGQDSGLELPESDMAGVYASRISKLQGEMSQALHVALERGRNPQLRAYESGREWHAGDGFQAND